MRGWPADKLAFLIANAATMSAREIADKLGKKPHNVHGVAAYHGLTLKSGGRESVWTPERKALVAKLWLEGKSQGQVAAALGPGFTRSMVSGAVKRLGLRRRVDPALAPNAAQPDPSRADRLLRKFSWEAAE